MRITEIVSDDVPAATGSYVNALEVVGQTRLVCLSGQIPVAIDGSVPDDFESQCRLVWQHIGNLLAGADMSWANLIKVTTMLSDRAHREANSQIRQEVLGEHRPALTVFIADIYDESWLLEIEAWAAA